MVIQCNQCVFDSITEADLFKFLCYEVRTIVRNNLIWNPNGPPLEATGYQGWYAFPWTEYGDRFVICQVWKSPSIQELMKLFDPENDTLYLGVLPLCIWEAFGRLGNGPFSSIFILVVNDSSYFHSTGITGRTKWNICVVGKVDVKISLSFSKLSWHSSDQFHWTAFFNRLLRGELRSARHGINFP